MIYFPLGRKFFPCEIAHRCFDSAQYDLKSVGMLKAAVVHPCISWRAPEKTPFFGVPFAVPSNVTFEQSEKE
jgi:hypothetical protein